MVAVGGGSNLGGGCVVEGPINGGVGVVGVAAVGGGSNLDDGCGVEGPIDGGVGVCYFTKWLTSPWNRSMFQQIQSDATSAIPGSDDTAILVRTGRRA